MADGGFKLNLSSLREPLDDEDAGGGAEVQLDVAGIMASPRAQTEAVLATPRTAKRTADTSGHFKVDAPHGKGPLAIACGLSCVATVGADQVARFWSPTGAQVADYPLHPPGACKATPEQLEAVPAWAGFDCSGRQLGVLRPGVGLWVLSLEPAAADRLARGVKGSGGVAATVVDTPEGGAKGLTACSWSNKVAGVLAAGTRAGRVAMCAAAALSPGDASELKLATQKDGKHPGTSGKAITAAAWLDDGRLALASAQRLKVSKPVGAKAEWATFSKFYIGKMVAKIPLESVRDGDGPRYDTTPTTVAASAGSAPFLALNLGAKVMTLMDSSGKHKEEGFFVPLDYGDICGFSWLADSVLAIGLGNGYIVVVSTPMLMKQRRNPSVSGEAAAGSKVAAEGLPSLKTTRVFEHYLAAVGSVGPTLFLLGDACLKLLRVDLTAWGTDAHLKVVAQIDLAFTPRVGAALQNLQLCVAEPRGVRVGVSASDGTVYGFEVPTAILGAAATAGRDDEPGQLERSDSSALGV